MAELIDKGATLVDMNTLLEELEDYIEYDTFDQYKEEPLINMSFETLEDVITSQPTTTEAEIRAKALGVMGMAMKEYYPSCKGAYVDFDVFFHAVMAKVAEQMEEGADND